MPLLATEGYGVMIGMLLELLTNIDDTAEATAAGSGVEVWPAKGSLSVVVVPLELPLKPIAMSLSHAVLTPGADTNCAADDLRKQLPAVPLAPG